MSTPVPARDLRSVGLVAAAVLLVASVVELGVLCPLRRLTGVPCPLCGLTTGVDHLLHAEVPAAVASHPLAPAAVALLALAWTPWGPAAVDALRRRRLELVVALGLVWVTHLAGITGP